MSQIELVHPRSLTSDSYFKIVTGAPVPLMQWVGTWYYSIGNRVVHNGLVYRCTTAGSSAVTPDNLVNWVTDSSVVAILPYNAATPYNVGDSCWEGNFVYTCKVAGAAGVAVTSTSKWVKSTVDFPYWVRGNKYMVGDSVTFGYDVYTCFKENFSDPLDNGTISTETPSTDAINWTMDSIPIAADYSSLVAYNVGVFCWSGDNIYECIKSGIAGVGISDRLKWKKQGTPAPKWVTGTRYKLGDRVTYVNSRVYIFKTENLAASTDQGNISIIEPPKASNKTIPTPKEANLIWVYKMKANAWLMLDGINHTPTVSNTNNLTFRVTYPSRIDAICLLGIQDATSLVINIYSGGSLTSPGTLLKRVPTTGETSLAGVTYDRIRNIDNITTYYLSLDTLGIHNSIAARSNLIIEVILTNSVTTGRPGVGTIIIGPMQAIGTTVSGMQKGATITTVDYSTTNVDEYGTVTVVPRPWVREINLTTYIPNNIIAGTQDLVNFLRATPCLWRISDVSTALIVYGLASDCNISVDYAEYSAMQLTIKGLI